MRCPFCGCQDDRVVDSRGVRDGAVIRRRRVCEKCDRRFTTYESIEESTPIIVKKDGRRQSYERQKFLRGIFTACQKRPVSRAVIESGVDAIEATLFEGLSPEVASTELGEAASEFLRRTDPVAYVRFASVYRSFTDVGQFAREVQEVRGDTPVTPPPSGEG